MPKKLNIKGWVPVRSKRTPVKTYKADFSGASPDVLKSKAGVAVPKKAKPVGPTKLRGVYVRPEGGDDSQAKLLVVDANNKAHYAQG